MKKDTDGELRGTIFGVLDQQPELHDRAHFFCNPGQARGETPATRRDRILAKWREDDRAMDV